jgi:type I restriction enzyme S subunit
MSPIDNLIREYCPEGVPFQELGSLIKLNFGARITKAQNAGTIYPVYGGGGESFRTDQFNREDEYVISRFAMSATCVRWVPGTFWMLDSGFTFDPIDGLIDKDFVAQLLFAMQPVIYACSSEGAQKNLKTEVFKKIRLPVPPLVVQREIVKALEAFWALRMDLESELKAELAARREQHGNIRDALLALASEGSTNWVALRDLVHFTNGKAHERFVDPEGEIALMTARFISTNGQVGRRIGSQHVLTPAHEDEVALVMSDLPGGRALARAFIVDTDDKYAANQRVCLLRVKDRQVLSPRFLYHFIDRNEQLVARDNGVDQTHLKKDWILDVRVPMVHIDEQERIARSLDRLRSASEELVMRIPLEIGARSKQYEYYRDKLLTFAEAS